MWKHRRNSGYLGAGVALIGLVVLTPLFRSETRAQHDHGDHGGPTKKSANWLPVDKMHLYLCAFHVAKENPSFQIEAHHFCAPQGGKVHQCVIYDNTGSNAKLLGVEYLVDHETYRKLPDAEKKYWHPHAYEILSGQLIAPDLANDGDEIFPGLLTTWGKTWHTWRDPTTELPIGEPMLMWSANGDNQVEDRLIDKRDAKFDVLTAKIRERRKSFGFGVPQIPAPKSINEVGRQWTPSGPDEPTR